MTQYKTRRSPAKTRGYLSKVIQAVFISENGEPLKLIEIERRGFVTYLHGSGTYALTEEGKKFLKGGLQQ